MKNIGLVFSFEFKAILRKKSYIITTIILCLVVLAAIIVPTIFVKGDDLSQINYTEQGLELDVDQQEIDASLADGGYVLETDALQDFATLSVFEKEYTTENELKSALEAQEISYGVIFNDAESYLLYTNGEKNTIAEQFINQSLTQYNREKIFKENNIDLELINPIYDLQINSTNIDISQQGAGNLVFGIVYTFLMYMMIIMYGATVSTSVAREKDNRTMEVLIANTKSDNLIIGKTLAAGLAGLLQILILVIVAISTIQLSGQSFLNIMAKAQFNLTPTTIITTIFFGLTGYVSYLFIYASLGALVSKVEDVNYSITPVMLVFILAYFMTFMGIQTPHSPVFKFASFFPLFSPLAMPVRSSIVAVPLIEIIISALIMLVSIAVFSIVAIRIYRLGSLNYGNRMKFGKTLKMIFRGEGK